MAEFFVEKEGQASGAHRVHFASCAALPAQANLRYLGSIASFDSAWTESKKYYHTVDACPECAAKYASA